MREAFADPSGRLGAIAQRHGATVAQAVLTWLLRAGPGILAQLESKAADAFGPGGGSGAEQAAMDVKSLHAKIGELTLENDFLEGALTKAGLLSAKR